MRQVRAWWPWLLIAAPGCGGPDTTPPTGARGKLDGVIEIDGLTSTAPTDWIQELPTGDMRQAQFRLPGAGGGDATLVVFRNIGGTAKANVERWKDQFTKTDVEPRVETFSLGGRDAALLDIQGTFDEGKSMAPHAGRMPPHQQPDYRMIAVHVDGKQGPFHIKLTGPARTVERYKQGFDDWLKAFK